jgi:hypothetical protein
VLTLDGDPGLLDAARRHEAYIARETLATQVRYDPLADTIPLTIDDYELRIAIDRA